jgi:hypothetical protein
MKALVIVVTLMISTFSLASSAKKNVKEKKIEKVKVIATPGPCLSPTPKAQDPFKKEEKKEEKGFSLQGTDSGCKLQ